MNKTIVNFKDITTDLLKKGYKQKISKHDLKIGAYRIKSQEYIYKKGDNTFEITFDLIDNKTLVIFNNGNKSMIISLEKILELA